MKKVDNTHCLVCNSTEFKHELNVVDHPISKESFDLSECSKCGFTFTNSAPVQSEIAKYYQSENYISHSDTKTGLVNKVYYRVRKIMLSRKHRLIKNLTAGKEILDIGCGTAHFLGYMKEKQYSTLGIEVDKKAREYGKSKFQIDILPTEKFVDGSINKKFSTITMWHVLEHIYDPREYLSLIKDLMNPDSYLIVALPNKNCFDAQYYKSYWAGYDVPRHLWHFSPETFERFAQSMNFEITQINRLPFDPFYISILSEKYQKKVLGTLKGSFVGLYSFMISLFNKRKSSSVVYVMKKASNKD